MYLKQLDTVGFKSFAERVKIEFVSGVTAVVGPNGSGKSNITDAIRWVLGEQSAKSLRGAKMEDIIFQGSDSRKPLNFAEVTLVLDNSDYKLPIEYEEVSVTRKVYRSGESEYLMNKQPCRLKDITELFLDSGLGREAFSIISQGKVEEILSSKSEERRVIFEEAAGVLKYKNRKKEAGVKLIDTEENLNRVEDIIYEIEGQLEPLEQQAMIAKEYVTQKERLTQVDVGLLVSEIDRFQEEIETLQTKLAAKEQELDRSKRWTVTKENEQEQVKAEVSKIDEEITSLQEEMLVIIQELENLEGNKKIFKERLMHYQENKENLQREISDLETKKIEYSNKLTEEQKQWKQFQKNRREARKQITSLQEQLNKGKNTMEEDIESLKSDYIELLNEQAAKRNEKHSIQKQLETMQGKQTARSSKWEHLFEERSQITTKMGELEEKLKKEETELRSLQAELEQKERKITVESKLLADMEQRLYKGYQMVENIKSKKEMLEDLKEDFQGFYLGVKEILKARENQIFKGIHGAIPELIEIDDAYVEAIETALGAQAQHIVVDNDKTAREAIQWLKKNNKGRATFLPIPSMKPKHIPANILRMAENEEEFVGVAADLISYHEKYANVMQSILGNILITKSLPAANRIAQRSGRRFRIVTLSGDIVNPGGSMTGGARKKSTQSLFTRDRELKSLTKKYHQYQRRVEDYEQQIQQQKDLLADLKELKQNHQQALDEKKVSCQDTQNRLKEWNLSLEHINDSLSIFDQDKLQQEQDYRQLQKDGENLAIDLRHLEKKLLNLDQEIKKLTDQHQNFEAKEEQLKKEMQALQVKEAEINSQVSNQREKITLTEESLKDTNVSIDQKQKQLKMLVTMKEEQQTEEEINQQIEDKRAEKVRKQAKLKERRENRQEKQEKITRLEMAIKKEKQEEAAVQEQLQTYRLQENRLELDLENRLTMLEKDYEMTYERAKKQYPIPENFAAAKEQVKLIKKSIEELGTVNLGAIEEYERIKERYDFLSRQQEDLLEAKRTLYDIMEEMDAEMSRKFSETFQQIKAEFTVVFQKLFGGGHAELKLTDPDHLLETGVEIIAQPPGKKLQHLGLLSGGERALTAIALLFAILRVRPVPFCVLDEVEAALDEANVVRFAQYLKKYRANTQFIVITHRKGTMEEADVLYGVTMQESGVSRLVSVKLEEAPELLEV